MRPAVGPCAVDGCTSKPHARQLCALHYRRWRTHGDPLVVLSPHAERAYTRRPEAERFWEKVEKTETCWLWIGGVSDTGYGSFMVWIDDATRRVNAHRWAYEATVGPIPAGLHLDHLCRVRRCVNPSHLEPVTNLENSLRGAAARRLEREHEEQCGDHSARCDLCGDRFCALLGPEPAITCPAHRHCVDCDTDNPCRDCADERRAA